MRCTSARIDLELGKNERISVAAELDYVVREGTPRILPFNLNGVLRLSSMEDGAGNTLAFIQEDRKLDSDPWVILAGPAGSGGQGKIKIRYQQDSTYESGIVHDRGGRQYSVAARASWYPSFGRDDDRTQFEINVRSAKGLKFVASGSPLKSSNEKDALVTSWKSAESATD